MNLPGYRLQPFPKVRPEQVKQIAAAIKLAKRPVIYAGGGIISAGASEELRMLVEKSGILIASYHEVMAGPLHAVNLWRAMGSIIKLIVGIVQSIILLLWRRPKSLLLTGGWANVPLAISAWLLRVPVLIYLPDIEPGLTIKVLKHFAKKIAITVPESVQYFREGQTRD